MYIYACVISYILCIYIYMYISSKWIWPFNAQALLDFTERRYSQVVDLP